MLTCLKPANWRDLPGIWRIFSLRTKLKDSLRHTTTFGWPLYYIRYFLWNRQPQKLYRAAKDFLSLNRVQQSVVSDLDERGISVIHISDLFPEGLFSQLQESAEDLLQTPEFKYQNRTEGSQRRSNQSLPGHEKSYLIRLLGDRPVLFAENPFLDFSLRDEILRIVCAYLGMLCRLIMVNVWCNIPTDGPDRFSQRWHRDPDDKKQVKIFLYLRAVDETIGPFCYIPGTHNGGALKNVFPQTIDISNYPPDEMIEKEFPRSRRLVCVGKPGALIFADTTGFHKGGHPVTASRLLLNSVYTTNGGAVLNQKRFGKFYSVAEWAGGSLTPLADYAIQLHRS